MSDERMKRARALYLAVYESQGGKWEANDCKELWCEKADRYLELAGAIVAQTPASEPEITAVHSALLAANIPYSAFSCNGFNLVGDSKSIKEVARAFHSHAQIDEFRIQIRHWREECGKLHAKLAASTVSSTHRGEK